MLWLGGDQIEVSCIVFYISFELGLLVVFLLFLIVEVLVCRFCHFQSRNCHVSCFDARAANCNISIEKHQKKHMEWEKNVLNLI